ncbi:MFS general substrate transporter [Periconia macrospinosa]|uniref:MFS general substrate transporter n=1 Tax=Periconia macrospinosa TaxID=97972 RepID=A0A2V1DDI2_9PLEO|nr:MFS general substrate transporter [Periconia macrospinosa]
MSDSIPTGDETKNARPDSNQSSSTLRIDGGSVAWLQVFASWLLFMNSWGLTSTFGVFQTYYSNTLIPSSSPSAISWIGSLQAFLTMFAGVFAGILLDIGFLKHVMAIGSCLEVFGMLMTSLSTKYYQLLFAQGACVGIGSGMLLLTSLANLSLYFERKRMIAAGIAATGSASTGVFAPIMLKRLIENIGFKWSVRAYTLVILTTQAVAFIVLKPRRSSKKSGQLLDLQYFKEPIYVSFILGFTFMMAANYVPYFFIEDYAIALGVRPTISFYLVSIMNAASVFGRVLPSICAYRYGSLNTLIVSTILSAVTLYCFRAVQTFTTLIVIAIAYCFASGGILFLPPIIMANLTKDPADYGTKIGMGYSIAAFGGLAGNPIAGSTLNKISLVGLSTVEVQKYYEGVWIVSGTAMVLGVIAQIVMRVSWVGWKSRARI